LSSNPNPVAGEIEFTTHGKLLVAVAVFLFAQGYALNNLTPAIVACMILAYAAFARLSFNEQLGTTKLAATRHCPERAFQDRAMPASLEIYNASAHSVWVEVEDDLPPEAEMASGSIRTTQVIEPMRGGRLSYTVRPIVRGRLVLDRFRLRLMDERGLMSVQTEQSAPRTVQVGPPIEKFKGGNVVFRREHPWEAVAPSSKAGGGYEFAGLRQYLPDDPFTSIEWKASSRLAKLMAKLTYEETRPSVYIFLDSSRSMRLARAAGRASKLDQSVHLAILLATHLVRSGFPVGLGAYDEHRILGFEPPGGGRMAPARLLSTISMVPGSRVVEASPAMTLGGTAQGTPETFISRILPFFGRRKVSSPERAAGIYAVVERLTLDGVKGGIVLIFSDLQTDAKAVTLSCRITLRRGHRVVIVTPFSPAFDAAGETITPEALEKLYLAYQAKRALMRRLERMGVQVIEVERGTEAIAKVSRELSRG